MLGRSPKRSKPSTRADRHGRTDIRPYLCRHTEHKGLFYAGLRDGDDFLSYELGLGAENGARNFVDRCAEQADIVILTCPASAATRSCPWHWMPVKSYCPSLICRACAGSSP